MSGAAVGDAPQRKAVALYQPMASAPVVIDAPPMSVSVPALLLRFPTRTSPPESQGWPLRVMLKVASYPTVRPRAAPDVAAATVVADSSRGLVAIIMVA